MERDWVAATANLSTALRVFGDRGELAPEVSVQLIRIVQEALTNVAQHARASSVRVGLVFGTEGVAVIVEDDGVGFDLDAVHDRRQGMGSSGLVARATRSVAGCSRRRRPAGAPAFAPTCPTGRTPAIRPASPAGGY